MSANSRLANGFKSNVATGLPTSEMHLLRAELDQPNHSADSAAGITQNSQVIPRFPIGFHENPVNTQARSHSVTIQHPAKKRMKDSEILPGRGGGPAKLVAGHGEVVLSSKVHATSRLPLHHPADGSPPRTGEDWPATTPPKPPAPDRPPDTAPAVAPRTNRARRAYSPDR